MSEASKKKKGGSKRYQRQQKFWLDGRNKKQNELANWCDELRKNRRFAPTARNGLALMRALEQGDTKLLFELFPGIYEQLFAQMEADVLERREDEAIQRLSRVEELLAGLSLPSASNPPRLEAGASAIRQLAVPQFEVNYDDDEEGGVGLQAVAAAVDGTKISANFLKSLGSL